MYVVLVYIGYYCTSTYINNTCTYIISNVIYYNYIKTSICDITIYNDIELNDIYIYIYIYIYMYI